MDLKAFDEAYEKCYFDKIVTTNLTYQLPELKDRPYYVEADMSKFLASIIDFMNHDSSMANVSTPTEKIHENFGKIQQPGRASTLTVKRRTLYII